MNKEDVKKIDASVKVLQEENNKLEKLRDEWSDKISDLEDKDTESSAEKAEELQELHDNLEEIMTALSEAIDNLNGLKDS